MCAREEMKNFDEWNEIITTRLLNLIFSVYLELINIRSLAGAGKNDLCDILYVVVAHNSHDHLFTH